MGIKLGILGAGAFAREFVALFKAHPLVDQLILCDHNADVLASTANRFGIAKTCATYDELLATDVSAIAIFTQHWLHAPQAVCALDSGRDVYSAVPAAASRDEMTALVAATERSKRIYMMGETSYYYTEAIYCRERFRAGDFGPIIAAQGEYLHDWDDGLYEVMDRRQPGWRKLGVVWHPMQYPTHSTGMVLSVTHAHALSVSCVGVRDTKPEDRDIFSGDNLFSNQSAVFAMSDGSAMRINEMRRIGHPGCERMSLYGTEASFERVADGFLWCTKQGAQRIDQLFAIGSDNVVRQRSRLPAPLRAEDRGHGGSHAFLADDFVRACAWRLQPPTNVWQAARYLLPGLLADESSRRYGACLDVPDFGAGPEVDFTAFERPFDAVARARSAQVF